jgi:hypothetical protein
MSWNHWFAAMLLFAAITWGLNAAAARENGKRPEAIFQLLMCAINCVGVVLWLTR